MLKNIARWRCHRGSSAQRCAEVGGEDVQFAPFQLLAERSGAPKIPGTFSPPAFLSSRNGNGNDAVAKLRNK